MHWKHKLWNVPRHFQGSPGKHIHVWAPVAAQTLCALLPSTNSWRIPEVSQLRAKPTEEEQEEGQRQAESESKVSEVKWWKPDLANPPASRSQHPDIFDLVWKKKMEKVKRASIEGKLVDTSELQMVCVPKQTVCLLLTQAKEWRTIWWCWRNHLPGRKLLLSTDKHTEAGDTWVTSKCCRRGDLTGFPSRNSCSVLDTSSTERKRVLMLSGGSFPQWST